MIKFKPSDMRHRVTFQKKTRVQNSEGIESTTWDNVETNIPASVLALSGSERIASSQTTANYTARVTIYKLTSINESMRMVFDGQYYDIKDILPDRTNQIYFNLMVTKYVAS